MAATVAGSVFESVAAGCRVCRDNAVESRFDQHVDHVVDLRVGQVGRYFQQDRPVLVLSAPEVDQTAQDQVQVVLVLQAGQVRDVRAADVDDEIVDVLVQVAKQTQVVRRSVFVARLRVFCRGCRR